MYPHVEAWLKNLLKSKFKNKVVRVADTSKKVLSRWLFEQGFHKYFEDYQTYEIEVDITGVLEGDGEADLVFVECKLGKITLRDLSQLLGYSKVANPLLSFIISPQGVSTSINLLLNVFRRNDLLYYSTSRFIIIGKWDEHKRELDFTSIIPRGTTL
ncbi:hypothetical protein DRN63_03515 [Nanoarchaeota archaeon]|nr:MAG: hypothetical protein DRN63_03515 [Nanoarchaeota archaeon]